MATKDWTHAQALTAVKTTEYAEYYTNGYDSGSETEQHEELVGMLEQDLGLEPPAKATATVAHASVSKAPALAKRLIKELEALGYDYDEAVAMLNESGTREIADFIKQELAEAQAYSNQPTAKTIAIKSEENNVALVIEVDNKGKTKSIERKDFGSGAGVEAARPLPTVTKQAPTVVEPSASVQNQTKPTASETPASVERLYDYNKLPAELQAEVERIEMYRMPHTLPVCQVVGFDGKGGDYRPILKVLSGQLQINAYGWLIATNAREWQNLPMLVVFPSDAENLRKARMYYNRPEFKELHTLFTLTCVSVVRKLTTIDYEQFAVVVAPPASDPVVSAKVKAKATKPAKEEPKTEAPKAKVTEQLLSDLATATNHMKRISIVNQILVALGEPKVASKLKKDELQPVVSRLLAQFNVPVAKQAPTAKATKAKVEKAPATPAPTKAALEKFFCEQLIAETKCTMKSAKAQFSAMDYNWRLRLDRATCAERIGFIA